jgi:hypothetical protein
MALRWLVLLVWGSLAAACVAEDQPVLPAPEAPEDRAANDQGHENTPDEDDGEPPSDDNAATNNPTDPQDPSDPSEDPNDPSEDPNGDPQDPNEDPQDPSEDPNDPQDPNEDPQDPNEDPQDPNEDPQDPSEDPQDPTDPNEDPPAPEEPGPCPQGVVCVDHLPFQHEGTTLGGQRMFDGYACAPEVGEAGPEKVYRVFIPTRGFLALELSGVEDEADPDVHLLHELDPAECVDRGHWRAGSLLDPGTYWVVVDSWSDDDGEAYPGDYNLSLHLTTTEDLEALGISSALSSDALFAFGVAWDRGETRRFEYAITDFSMHSSYPRQWIVNLADGRLLWHLHVAHGAGSVEGDDPGIATDFSNVPESHKSSLGMVRTAETYVGDYGFSCRLDGLEEGFNDNVRRRAIVLHPWEGVRPSYIRREGHARPSWGCPAVDDAIAPQVVEQMADGALMFFWHPDSAWYEESRYLP